MWLWSLQIKSYLEDSNNKPLLAIYNEFLPEVLLEWLKPSNTLEEFWEIQGKINKIVNELFSNYVDKLPYSMRETFDKWSLMWFNGTNQEREKILNLIFQKNRLYYAIMLAYVKNGGIDSLMKDKNWNINYEELNNVVSLLASEFIYQMDNTFIKWLNIWEKNIDKIPSWLIYWWVTENGVVPYGNLLNKQIKLPYLSKGLLRDYLEGIEKLFSSSTSKKDWEKNIENEPQIWKDLNWKLGVVGPQEAYYLKNDNWVLVEPHFAVYIKEVFDKEKDEAIELYKKYFWEDYNVNSLNCFVCEPVIECGSIGFQKIAWESIPNSAEVSKKYWKINLIIPSRIKNRMKGGIPYLEKLIGKSLSDKEKKLINQESDIFVKFHELWHSLFLNEDYKNELEELKADLSYFLKIYSDVNEWKSINIESVLNHLLIDAIRIYKNINPITFEVNKNMTKYVISATIELKLAFETGIIKFLWDKLMYNKDKFKDFLDKLKALLIEIKKSYDDKNDKIAEFILSERFSLSDPNIEKLIKIANSEI